MTVFSSEDVARMLTVVNEAGGLEVFLAVANITTTTSHEVEERFNDLLDETFPAVRLLNQYEVDHSGALKSCDPKLYRQALVEYEDRDYFDIDNRLIPKEAFGDDNQDAVEVLAAIVKRIQHGIALDDELLADFVSKSKAIAGRKVRGFLRKVRRPAKARKPTKVAFPVGAQAEE